MSRVRWTALCSVHLAFPALALCCWLLLFGSTLFDDGQIDTSAWRNVLGDTGRWFRLLATSLQVLLISVAISLPPALLAAWLLFRTRLPGRTFALLLVALAASFPFHVSAASWLALFDLIAWRESSLALGVVHGISHLPASVWIIGLTLRNIPRSGDELAATEGARAFDFLRINARHLATGLVAATTLQALWIVTDFSASDLLQVRTFAEEVYTQFALHGRAREPTLASLPQIVLFAAFLWMLLNLYTDRATSAAAEPSPLMLSTGRWSFALSSCCILLGLALCAAPLVLLSRNMERSKSLLHYVRALSPEIVTTLWTSLVAASICSTLAIGLAWYLARGRFRHGILIYITGSLAMPAPLIGISLILLLNRPGPLGELYDSRSILIFVYVLRFLPIAILITLPFLRAVPRQVEESAQLDGCDGWNVWWRIVVPRCLPAALISFLAVIILCFGELPASFLVKPAGYETVSSTFFSFIHYGLAGEAAALCLLSIIAVGILLIALFLVYRGLMKHIEAT